MRRSVTLSCYCLLLAGVCLGGTGCGLFELLFGGGDGPAPSPLPPNAILVTFDNQSGLPVRVDATFVDSEQDVRRTTRKLAADGSESTVSLLRTTAERIEVVIRIEPDKDEASSTSPLAQPGAVLLDKVFFLFADYQPGSEFNIIIPPPAADCNTNGVPDADEIADGTLEDCDANGIPDACENDTDGDGLIDACDNCPAVENADQADTDSDGIADACDNCPAVENADQADANGNGIGDVCDTQGCCLYEGECQDMLEADCLDIEGSPAGNGVDCADAHCGEGLDVFISSDNDWVYENYVCAEYLGVLPYDVTPHAVVTSCDDVTSCDVTFYASVGGYPARAIGNYSYIWTIDAPSDQPLAAFGIVTGGGTESPTYRAPDMPGFSPSGAPYIVTVIVTDNDTRAQGEATFPIYVRFLGDVNNDGCTDADDRQIIRDVEDGEITDPAIVAAADINCDGTVDANDRQLALTIEEAILLGDIICPSGGPP